MFNHVLALFVFLVSGFLAELIYCKITNEKQNHFAMIVRIILCCVLTLIMRIFVTYAMGNDGTATANFFVTSEDIVKYLLLSIVCGILFPLIYILLEKGILLRIRAKTLSNNETVAQSNTKLTKKEAILGIGSIAIVVVIIAGGFGLNYHRTMQAQQAAALLAEEEAKVKPSNVTYLFSTGEIDNLLALQEAVDEDIQVQMNSQSYSIENPYVLLNPYAVSPLTAICAFTTEENTTVSMTVEGTDRYTSASYDFEELTTTHIIPVVGLYADKENVVTLTTRDEQGKTLSENSITIQTEALPASIDNIIIQATTFSSGYQDGLNFVNEQNFAFDKEGDVRWYLDDIDSYLTCMEWEYTDGHYIFASGADDEGSVYFYEMDRLGKIYRAYTAPYGAHHDISPMPNDNLIINGCSGQTVEDFLYEIDVQTGLVANTLDLKEVLQRTRPATHPLTLTPLSNLTDWAHVNSAVYDENDDTIVISANFQSAIVKLSWPEGEIKWILSPPVDWYPQYQQYLLSPIGEDFEYAYNQHAVSILPDLDNDADTIDILVFDNGASRFSSDLELQRQISAYEIVAPTLYSRLVHYRINEKTMEVEQIWQYGKERGTELFSAITGDAYLLESGNYYGFFCRYNQTIESNNPMIIEVSNTSQLIWEAELFTKSATGTLSGYRASRLPFYFDNQTEQDIETKAVILFDAQNADAN